MIRFCKNGHSTVDKREKVCPICGGELHIGCPQCLKDWNACQCPSWPVRYFIFARPQVFWLLHNGLIWPEGIEGFDDEPIKHKHNQSAPFESISCVIAEIEARLKLCGDAGEALVDEAPYVDLIDKLSRPARKALNYCSGWRRRRQSFAKWRYDQNRKYSVDLIKT